jgi:small subunit ribosomal protein S19
MARIFTFHGYTIEQLRQMSLEDFTKILPARERRKIKRGFRDAEKKLLREVRAGRNFIKTHCRDMIVLPEMTGIKIAIFNGKEFQPIEIKPEMVGHRLGEFALTRKQVKHSAPGVGATRSSKYVPLK